MTRLSQRSNSLSVLPCSIELMTTWLHSCPTQKWWSSSISKTRHKRNLKNKTPLRQLIKTYKMVPKTTSTEKAQKFLKIKSASAPMPSTSMRKLQGLRSCLKLDSLWYAYRRASTSTQAILRSSTISYRAVFQAFPQLFTRDTKKEWCWLTWAEMMTQGRQYWCTTMQSIPRPELIPFIKLTSHSAQGIK